MDNKKKSSVDDIFLNEEGEIITNQKKVANKFNTYYVNVAKKLVDMLGKTTTKYQDYLKNPNKHSIFLNEIEPDEVLTILKRIDIKKATDVFGISPKLVKIAATSIYINLTKKINRSFELGQFPDKLKTAKVIPIHKAESKMITSNYRPISLLPIISKIFEKIMHARIMSFVNKENILYKKQFGFQSGKSTEHAVMDIHSKVVDALANQEKPCCVFLDFAKAFDTVNHSILINKLNYYGIRGNSLNWLQSYLKDRQQCVQVGNSVSDFQTIQCGVPQGSVLGPLLFLLYINDIAKTSDILDFHLFVDDTGIFLSHKNLDALQSQLNKELSLVSEWLIANKLSLNVSKSNVLLFKPKNGRNSEKIFLNINGKPIQEKEYAKYLGILIDNKLTWEYQMQHIDSKIVKGNSILAKLRHYVPKHVLHNLYNAFIQPYINYGALTWGTCANTHMEKIEKKHNKTIRIINFKYKEEQVNPLYYSSKILPVKENIKLLKGKFMWRMVHSFMPHSIQELFERHGAIHSNRENDKIYNKLRLPNQTTSNGLNFIVYNGTKLWNIDIPNELTMINT